MKNQSNTTIKVVIALLLVTVAAVVGYLLLEGNDDQSANDPEQTNTQQTNNSQPATIDNEYFSLTLPEGWEEVAEPTATAGAPEATYKLQDGSGRSIEIGVNSLGFGGGGDGSANFAINDGSFALDEQFEACDPDTDQTGACSYGDGSLDLIVNSTDEHNGDSFIFFLEDANSEANSAYSELADIIESISLK